MLISSVEKPSPLILLVDDAPEDRQMVRRFLTREGGVSYRLNEAAGIGKAVALAASERPDCVVLDFNLIDGDGLGLLQQLVADHGANSFGIIMLTGSGEASVAVQALQYGAHDYIEKKGLTGAALRRSVANAIDKAAIQRELAEQRRLLAVKNDELAAHVAQLQHEAAERQRAEVVAKETALQMRAVTDHLPVSVAQFDRNYRYRFANLCFAARYDKTPEAIVGKTITEIVGAELFAADKEKMDLALGGDEVRFETAVTIPQGERWLSVTYVPERDDAGAVVGFVAVSADISERRQAEMAISQARDEAVAATEARDNFLAALSHELRTPLNPVLLIASDAAENAELSPEVRADFAAIRNHVELEAHLIDDLLDLSRISHGKISLRPRSLALHAVIRSAVAIVKTEADGKRIHIELRFSAEEAPVNADEVRLQQVFWNILKNAVKFTPAGGTVTVDTRTDAARECVIARVTDSGIGLSAEEIRRIFDAFSQGDHALNGGVHRFGGLGLGLAITRALVEAHGGRIFAESDGVDRGAAFVVELPLAVAGSAPAMALPRRGFSSRSPVSGPAEAKSATRQAILLIEDHASTRASLKMLLERRGFTVVAVESCAKAQEAVRASDFALIISDIGLPDGDGYACMEALRKIRPGVRGIALTGYGMEEDRRRSREVGFVDHLIKPVNMQSLDRSIAQALDGSPAPAAS